MGGLQAAGAKAADIAVDEFGSTAYYEIKVLEGSEVRVRIGYIQWQIAKIMFELLRTKAWSGQLPGYRIEIGASVLEVHGSSRPLDAAACSALLSEFQAVIAKYLDAPILLSEFVVAKHIHVIIEPDCQSSISGPPVPPEAEPKRVLEKHFKKPSDQLPTSSPGILIVEPSCGIETLLPFFTL